MLRRGERVPLAEALRWIGEIARALDAAHRAGLIHRDVKPDNILIEGPDRHAVLADFGIAKAAGGSELTTAGVAIGSPKYMSPEQASAERDVDARSDIWSLGAVAYELLSGRRPYEAESLQRLLVLQLTTEPANLSSVAPQVPSAVTDAVMRALAREPNARWQTSGEFAAALSQGGVAIEIAERESWFARRGLVLAALFVIGSYITLASFVLSNASRNSGGVTAAVGILRAPFFVTIALLFGVAWFELIVVMIRSRPGRTDGTWRPAFRAAFGQPRWWQPWYPRWLRSPESAWELMPIEIKALRTLLWMGFAAVPMAIPLIWGTPQLVDVAYGAAMPLPLPARLWIAASAFMMKGPGYVLMALIPIGVAATSVLRRVPAVDVIALLLTWRRTAWNSPAGLRVRRAPSPP